MMTSVDRRTTIPAATLGSCSALHIHDGGKQEADESKVPALGRSASQRALFNEPIYPVPIMDLPVASIVEEGPRRISVSCSPHRGPLAHGSSTVEVRDVLLGVSFEVQAGRLSTVKELKHQIQCVQGRSGYRIIPSHAQQISIDGYELQDGALVCDNVDAYSVVCVEPRVTELFSFFLSSVSSLHSPKSPACSAQHSPSASSPSSSTCFQSSSSSALGLQTCSDGGFLMDPFDPEPHVLMAGAPSRRYPRSTASSESVQSSLHSSPAHSPPFGLPMGMESPPTGMLLASVSDAKLLGITRCPPRCKDMPKSSKGVLVMPDGDDDAMVSSCNEEKRITSSARASPPLVIKEEERCDDDSSSTTLATRLRANEEDDAKGDAERLLGHEDDAGQEDAANAADVSASSSDSSLVADTSFVCAKDLSSPPPPPKHDPTPAKDVPLPRPSTSAWRPRSLRVLINEWQPPASSPSPNSTQGWPSAASLASGKDTVSACSSLSWSEGEETPTPGGGASKGVGGVCGVGGGGGGGEESSSSSSSSSKFAPGTSYTGKSILSSLFSPKYSPKHEREAEGSCTGLLDARMLRAVGEAGTAYSSHTHLILRGARTHSKQHRQSLALLEARRGEVRALEQLVLEVQSGLRHGHTPEEMMGELVGGCCGGTYVMRNNAGQKAAVFKPMDEEPYAPHNPKGFSSGSMDGASAMRAGIPVGGGAFRECAAFLLDRGGFAQVPSTTMLRITHSSILATLEAEVQIKAGSLQRFCEHECTVEDVGTASFPPEQVHAIGVFDVRTFNMDRNSDNILFSARGGGGGGGGAGAREDDDDDDEEAAANACRGVTRAAAKASARLVPIDHGYILPSLLHLEEVVACWLHWPQAKLPFSPSTLEYIDALDADADVEMLRSALGLSEESLMTLFLGTSLIKLAAAAGLTLHQIGKLMLRSTPEAPSAVEEVVTGALQALSSPAGAFPCADADRERLKHELRERLTALVAAAAAPAAPAAVHACCT